MLHCTLTTVKMNQSEGEWMFVHACMSYDGSNDVTWQLFQFTPLFSWGHYFLWIYQFAKRPRGKWSEYYDVLRCLCLWCGAVNPSRMSFYQYQYLVDSNDSISFMIHDVWFHHHYFPFDPKVAGIFLIWLGRCVLTFDVRENPLSYADINFFTFITHNHTHHFWLHQPWPWEHSITLAGEVTPQLLSHSSLSRRFYYLLHLLGRVRSTVVVALHAMGDEHIGPPLRPPPLTILPASSDMDRFHHRWRRRCRRSYNYRCGISHVEEENGWLIPPVGPSRTMDQSHYRWFRPPQHCCRQQPLFPRYQQ